MFLLEATATLPYSPAAVFAALASVESALHWQVGVVGARRARGRPGGAVRLGYFALGVRHTLEARVTACEPPVHFAFRADGPAFALDVALAVAPALGGAGVTYRLAMTTHPPPPGDPAHGDPVLAAAHDQRVAAFRRLLARRAPRDLVRLEHHVARWVRTRRSAVGAGVALDARLAGVAGLSADGAPPQTARGGASQSLVS